jgi:hypothetical protein
MQRILILFYHGIARQRKEKAVNREAAMREAAENINANVKGKKKR